MLLLRLIDRLTVFMAVLAGIYLVVIMFGIVFQATARSLNYSGSSHVFTFTEFGAGELARREFIAHLECRCNGSDALQY